VIFKRKSAAKPAGRARQASPDHDTTEPNATDDSPSTLATKLKKKIQRAKPKSRLSFGGEEEEVCCLFHESSRTDWFTGFCRKGMEKSSR